MDNSELIYFQLIYAIVIGTGLLCMVILLWMVHASNPGYYCTRDLENPCGVNGEYWKQLVDIQLPLSISDIVCLIFHSLVILLLVLSFIVVCSRKTIKTDKTVIGFLIATEVVFTLFYFYTVIITNRLVPGSSYFSREVHSQLKNSLLVYVDGEDDIINNAWEGTLKDGCCCGVDGYTDFLDLGAEIPEYCTCTSNMTSNSSTPRCYDSQHECEIEHKYNVTTKGCYQFISSKIRIHLFRISGRMFYVSMWVYIIQSLFLIFSIMILWSYTKQIYNSSCSSTPGNNIH